MQPTAQEKRVAIALPLGPVTRPGWFWRIVQFPIARIFILLVASGLGQALISGLFGQLRLGDENPLGALAISGAVIAMTVLVYVLFVRWIERRSATELALKQASRELGIGALLGFAAITATVFLMWLAGAYRVVGTHSALAMVAALTIGLVPAFTEEILFRGILYRIVEGSLGTWAALITTSLLFGVSHLANPNASWFAAFAIAIEAGLLLGAAYTVTQRLWISIGLHFAWNWAQGGVYGVPVSGISVNGLLDAQVEGPALLAGGGFGAEATIFAIAVCVAIFALMMVRVYRTDQLILPFWQRKRLLAAQTHAAPVAAA